MAYSRAGMLYKVQNEMHRAKIELFRRNGKMPKGC
jgi:hypothetical protein